MKKILVLILVIWGILCFSHISVKYQRIESPKVAVEAQIKPKIAIRATKKVKVIRYTISKEKVALIAKKYAVSQETMHQVIACESGYNPKAVGDGGKSFGLVQIHLPSHPNITKEQALDEDFALDFLGKSLAEKKGKMWTCFRNLKVV